MHWAVQLYGDATAGDVSLTAAPAEFSRGHRRYSVSADFGGTLSATDYLPARASGFDRGGGGGVHCLGTARNHRPGHSRHSLDPGAGLLFFLAGVGRAVSDPGLDSPHL